VLALRDSPYFARPVLDAETYYWAARALAAGEGWAEPVYWQPPATRMSRPQSSGALLLARAALDAGCGAEADVLARRALALEPRCDLARTLLREAQTLQVTRPGAARGGRVFVAPLPLAA
jgi:hypothetical protein